MIDIRLQTIGGPEVAAKLAQTGSGIRDALRDELAEIGDEGVDVAQSRAPKRTGILASRIQWYFGKEVTRRSRGRKYRAVVDSDTPSKYARKDYRAKYAGAIFFTMRPTGRVAHLMERGVSATFYQRTGQRKHGSKNFERAPIGPFMGQRVEGPQYRYERSLRIAPRPFFQPAVDSVGGASGVNARLQSRLDWLAGELSGVR